MKTLSESARKPAFEQIQKSRLKTIRMLSSQRSQVPVVQRPNRRDIIGDYANFGSKVYAPLQRDGRFPERRAPGDEIDPSQFLPADVKTTMSLERSLPPGTLKVKPELPKKARYLPCAERQREKAVQDVEYIGKLLETVRFNAPPAAGAGADSRRSAGGPAIACN